MKRTLSVLILLVLVASARPARADSGDALLGLLFIGGIAGGAAVGAGSLVPLIGASVRLGRHTPSQAWGVAALIVGSLDMLGGALWIGLRGGNAQEWGIGSPFLLVGGANIGVGVASITGAKRLERARVSVVPVGGLDATGHQMAGAALRFTF